jgi:inosine/xanthosine triphosphatase
MLKRKVKIIVASENPIKIQCVKNIFSKFFEKIEVVGKKIKTKLPEQPKTEEETIQGAIKRAEEIVKKYRPDFGVGIEGGLEYIEGRLFVFAWVCIKSKAGKIGLGRTASFPLPPIIEKLIKEGKELGEPDDIVFGIKNSKRKMGAIGLLSHGKLDRTKLYEQKEIITENNKKLVYFCAPVKGDRRMKNVVRELIEFIKENGVVVLTEHVGANKPLRTLAQKIGKEKLLPQDIEKQDLLWLDKANFVIAEVSAPSLGVGREIEYARTKWKFGKTPAKILCLYKKSKESQVSAMIKGMDRKRYPNVWLKPYQNVEEAKKIISKFLKNIFEIKNK